MRLKLVAFALAGLAPFLFFLPQLHTSRVPYTLTKLSNQGDGNLLLNEKNWKIKLNSKDCKYLGQFNYKEAKKFVVKCQENSDSKELAFPAYVNIYGDSINFWLELEREDFNDNLVNFYSFFWSKRFRGEINKPFSDKCLFEGNYEDKYSLCLVSWKELNNLVEFMKNNWIKDHLGREIQIVPND